MPDSDVTVRPEFTPNKIEPTHPTDKKADIKKEAIPTSDSNRVFIESVENVSETKDVSFNADNKGLTGPEEAAAGYTRIDKVYTIFQIEAKPAQTGGYVKLTVKAQLSEGDKPENVKLIRISSLKPELCLRAQTPSVCSILSVKTPL